MQPQRHPRDSRQRRGDQGLPGIQTSISGRRHHHPDRLEVRPVRREQQGLRAAAVLRPRGPSRVVPAVHGQRLEEIRRDGRLGLRAIRQGRKAGRRGEAEDLLPLPRTDQVSRLRFYQIHALKGARMPTIHLHQTTTLTPEQYIAGLTDFGPGRSKLFGNSADAYLKVHHQGSKEADVTEGSRGIWERLHYDWSDPNHVVLKTTDSNVWGGNSGHNYNFKRNPNGTTDIDYVVVRDGKNLKGQFLGLVVGTIGKSVPEKAFVNSVKAIEARSGAGTGGGASRAT